jgi:hypothetical protein
MSIRKRGHPLKGPMTSRSRTFLEPEFIPWDELKVDYFITRPLLWKIRREIDDRIEPILLEKRSDDSGFISEIIKHGIII